MIITNSGYALVGYFITSYPTRAHGIIVIYFSVFSLLALLWIEKIYQTLKTVSDHINFQNISQSLSKYNDVLHCLCIIYSSLFSVFGNIMSSNIMSFVLDVL